MRRSFLNSSWSLVGNTERLLLPKIPAYCRDALAEFVEDASVKRAVIC
jgi:hypothetical protein